MVIGVLDDVRYGFILYKPVIDNLVAITGAHAAGHFPDGAFIIKHCLDTL